MTAALLRRLEQLEARYGDGLSGRKRDLLRRLERARLGSPAAVHRFHEVLCFLRAYPDDAKLLGDVNRLLAGFARRPDLRRHAAALVDSGIAGTPIVFPFFAETARWLARRFPGRLSVEWKETEEPERLERVLPLLALYAESPALDELAFSVPEWVDRLKGPRETDAAFLVQRVGRLAVDTFLRESLYDGLGLVLRLAPGPATPCRTHAHASRGAIVFQTAPLRRGRPDLGVELERPPRGVTEVSRREGQRLIDLARDAMVTRSRDLDAFAYGDARDVRVVDCGGGLELVAIGLVPERRLLLEAVYGFLTLKNGVPIGYVLNSALFGSAEIAYNIFETWRGTEAAWVYGRVLATVRRLFGARSFTIYPYQLGDGNDEALESGAWWFYQKLGYRPRDPGARRLMRAELRKMRRRAGHRSSRAVLRRLARENVYLFHERERDDVIGLLPLENVGLAVVEGLARRFGADRERAARVLAGEAAETLDLASLGPLSPAERLWWRRWAPLVAVLPGVRGWTRDERHALGRVVLAKGGRRESDYVALFDAHRRLRAAVRRLARGRGRSGSRA
jgi:hypothetical protein